jgi:hypothetical protein
MHLYCDHTASVFPKEDRRLPIGLDSHVQGSKEVNLSLCRAKTDMVELEGPLVTIGATCGIPIASVIFRAQP